MKKLFNKKGLCVLLALVMCLSVLSACGSNEKTVADPTPASGDQQAVAAATEAAPAEPEGEIIAVINQEIVSVDPADQAQRATSQVLIQMYETLLRFDENSNPVPFLAEYVNQVDDLTYDVKLREGVYFQNGEEMKASDAVFSLSRALANPKTASALGAIDPEGFEITGDYSFTMKTIDPNAAMLVGLCNVQSAILSEKAVTELGESFGKTAKGCGTGPFEFSEWNDAIDVVLTRNPNYWGEPAKVLSLRYKFVSDANSRNVMLETGEAHIIYDVQVAGIEALLDNSELTVFSTPSSTIRFIYLNQSEGKPMANKALRQAISYAIDRDALVKNVFGDYATPATSFLAGNILGHTDDLETYEYNPEMAKAKLAEAGYEPGELTLTMSMHAQNVLIRMAEVIQAYLADVGINMEIESLDTAAWVAALAEGTTEMGFNANSNTSLDPHVLYTPAHSSNIPAPNHGRVNDPKLDEMLEKGMQTFDRSEREKIYIEAQQLIADECYMYCICYDNVTVAIRNELQGYTQTNNNSDRFVSCWIG